MATTVKMEGENQGEFIDMNRDFSYDQYNREFTKVPTQLPTLASNLNANADEAAAICAFVTSTNINSKRNDWSCDNTANRCSWPGITCQVDNKINSIYLAELGISGKKHI